MAIYSLEILLSQFGTSPLFPHLFAMMGPDTMIFNFWMLSFKPTFSLSSFTSIKRLFSYSSLSAVRVVSSVYLRLLIFPLAMLIPACVSSSPAFHMMDSAYKLNKQGDNIEPWDTPFPIWNQSVVPCPVLTVASWPAYRFLRRQVRWSGIPISWRLFHSLWKYTHAHICAHTCTHMHTHICTQASASWVLSKESGMIILFMIFYYKC